MITPAQVRHALRDYPYLAAFLAVWFPAGSDTAVISKGGAGHPTERLVLARADVQSVLDALTYAVSLLRPLDRRIVVTHYLLRRDVWGTAETLGLAARTVRRRLESIHSEVAVTLNRVDAGYWGAFRRFARVVCADDRRRCVCGRVVVGARCPKCGAAVDEDARIQARSEA